MIEVQSWATPNGHKVHIMLEECGLAYRAHPIDIGSETQFAAEFLAISPNNKIAAFRAAQRGVEVLADLRKPITDDRLREGVLFGRTQYARH